MLFSPLDHGLNDIDELPLGGVIPIAGTGVKRRHHCPSIPSAGSRESDITETIGAPSFSRSCKPGILRIVSRDQLGDNGLSDSSTSPGEVWWRIEAAIRVRRRAAEIVDRGLGDIPLVIGSWLPLPTGHRG